MQVQRLLSEMDRKDGLKALICWCGVPIEDDNAEPLQQVYDVPNLLIEFRYRNNTPQKLATKARQVLGLLETGV